MKQLSEFTQEEIDRLQRAFDAGVSFGYGIGGDMIFTEWFAAEIASGGCDHPDGYVQTQTVETGVPFGHPGHSRSIKKVCTKCNVLLQLRMIPANPREAGR